MTEQEQAAQIGYDREGYGVSRFDLEAMGERVVRDALNSGKFAYPGHETYSFVSTWLADKEFARLEADSAKRDEREARTLAIAEEANRLASEANVIARSEAAAAARSARWAMYAAIIAAVVAMIANQKEISALIFGYS